jgi:YVTN family beta-propeller protein
VRAWGLVAALVLGSPPVLSGQDPGDYLVGVVSEAGDIVTWLRPTGAGGLVLDRVVPLGLRPADVDGPHHLAVAPDRRSYYVSLAHGMPDGSLWRLDAATDSLLGSVTLERFPTTIALSLDGQWAVVANSDFHGQRPRTNPVSIVWTPGMVKVADLPACDMPHGVRVHPDGTRFFVACMHSDELLELDAGSFEIRRRVSMGARHGAHAAGCNATYVSMAPDGTRLYVACQASGSLRVHDATTLALLAERPAGAGAYNVEASPDGRWVLVTNKKDQSVSVYDAATLDEAARVRTSRPLPHGIAFSPTGRRAYISVESVGSDPGAVDVLDLQSLTRTASFPVPAQPTGIAVLAR